MAGGGPGGLKAAITAAKRGHKVILCEMSDQLGGILRGEKAIPFKYEMYELGVTLGKQARIPLKNTENTKTLVKISQ